MNSDARLKEFWGESSHFADLFNTVLFDGDNVILPETLTEAGTDLSLSFQEKGGGLASIEKRRDVFKNWKGHSLAILGIENQMQEEYTLPERILLYDALGYEGQRRKIARRHRMERDIKEPAEYLSGFKKTDKLLAQATIVVYYGEEPWKGPERLTDIVEVPQELRRCFNDYRIFVFSINESDGSEFKDSEVRKILRAAYNLRRRQIQELGTMNAEEIAVLGAFVNSKRIASLAENKQEGIDMCTALEEMIKEGEQRGMEQGIEQGIEQGRDLNYT